MHLNDSGVPGGRDEQVPLATFDRAWAPNHYSVIVTKIWNIGRSGLSRRAPGEASKNALAIANTTATPVSSVGNA